MKRLSENRNWFLAAIVITLATLGLLFAPLGQAAAAVQPVDVASLPQDQPIFNEDLVVESGQTISENVSVFRGDVVVEEGGVINGDLSVFSGEVEIDGTVDGDLAVIGGDVELGDTARITGDVSVVGGRLERAPNAFIGGNFVGGPRANIEQPEFNFQTPEAPARVQIQQDRPWIISFLVRLLQAILWTLLVTGLVVLIAWLFPKPLREMRNTGVEQPALSFAVGLVVSLATLMVGGILFVTVCLIPFSLLLWGLLAIVALVGWAVLSLWLGEYIQEAMSQRANMQLHPLVPVMLGALLLTGVSFLAWSILPCLGLIVAVLLGSTGLGAVLVYLARRSNFAGGSWMGGSGSGEPTPPTTPSGTTVVVTPTPAPATPEAPAASTVETTATGVSEEDSSTVAPTTVVEESSFVTGEELGLTDEERHQLRQGAGMTAEPDNFLKIRGIGPAFNRKLLDAGVTTYRQLAAMSPEEIAAIVGWPPERVIRDQLREQAADLAEQG